MSAARAASSRRSETPSQTRFSMVPSWQEGRMSQRMSERSSTTPVVSWSWANASYSAQVANWNGSPAVGSCWNIRARLDA